MKTGCVLSWSYRLQTISEIVKILEGCEKAQTSSDVPIGSNLPWEQWRRVSAALAVEILGARGHLEHVVIDDLREVLRQAEETSKHRQTSISSCAVLGCGGGPVDVSKELAIDHCVFAGQIILHGTYHDRVHLSYNCFYDYIHLGGSIFKKDLRLCNSHVCFGANLGWCDFEGGVDCRGVRFYRNTHYSCVTFGATRMRGVLDFTRAVFDAGTRLDLSEMRLLGDGSICLDMSHIGKWQRIPLRQLFHKGAATTEDVARVGRAILVPQRWRRNSCVRIMLRRFVFPIIRLFERKWPSTCLLWGEETVDAEELRKAASQYNMLRDNFRKIPSKDDEEDRCHYKYKDVLRRSTQGRVIWRLWDWGVNKWCLGYGICWYRPLLTGIVLILGFALLYKIGFAAYGTEVFQLEPGGEFSALYFSLITFATIGYGDCAPLGFLRYVAGVEGLLGLVIMALFTVSFARRIIR